MDRRRDALQKKTIARTMTEGVAYAHAQLGPIEADPDGVQDPDGPRQGDARRVGLQG